MSFELPIIDVSCFLDVKSNENTVTDGQKQVANAIEAACRNTGFFYVKGHGIPAASFQQLEAVSKQFFSLPLEDKMGISMQKGGRAWRGYFPVGGELTSGKEDQKEGIYFGTELDDQHPRVLAQTPLHGKNLWPHQIDKLQQVVLTYMQDVTEVAQAVLKGIALSLGLETDYFQNTYTHDPTVLFRIFNYPPSTQDGDCWGVGEHTDYGLLTLLAQDQHNGLEVYSQNRWISAPPIENYLVCNIGDMLDKLTAGWDDANLHSLEGSYGEYLLNKVSKVFPALTTDLL